jgi:hypothetical protein
MKQNIILKKENKIHIKIRENTIGKEKGTEMRIGKTIKRFKTKRLKQLGQKVA